MTKHQTVALLETAAILTSGSSLPEEKSFWPAAVSPPTSGLLGCETLNTETLNRMPYGSFSSSMKSSVPTIPSKLNSQAGSTDSENATDPDNEDDDEESASREEDMFAMEEDLPPASGMVSGMEEDYAQPSPPRQAPAHPLFKMQRSTVPLLPSHYSQSAPGKPRLTRRGLSVLTYRQLLASLHLAQASTNPRNTCTPFVNSVVAFLLTFLVFDLSNAQSSFLFSSFSQRLSFVWSVPFC
jgi:hypothetical protein